MDFRKGNDRTKYVMVLIAVFVARATLAQEVTCDAHTPHELSAVLTVAVGLNDAVATTRIAAPHYFELHAMSEHYEERQALPCAAAAAGLLENTPDDELARALLEFAAKRASSTSEILPRSLARFLSSQPAAFSQALRGLSSADRCAVVETAADAAHAAEHDGVVALLERQHCHVPIAKPANESQRNRARARPDPGRRESRPRFARAAPAAASPLVLQPLPTSAFSG